MPKQNNKPNRNRKRKRKESKNGPNPKRRKRAAVVSRDAAMLLDPCGAVLRPGFHSTSEGILSRFKTNTTSLGYTSGYMLWSPHYVAKTSTNRENAFIWGTDAPANSPANSVAVPFGTGTNTAQSLNVGASVFVSDDTCADFRLLSACMKLTYTGPVTSCAGLIAPIEGIPIDVLLSGDGGDPISVDHLFTLGGTVKRLPLSTLEIRHRPDAALTDSFKSDLDSIITKGTAASVASAITSEAKRFAPTVFGFAWKGVPVNSLNLDFTQNIEWRPEGAVGLVSPPARQLHDPGHTAKILKQIDDAIPGWQTMAMDLGAVAFDGLVKKVFTGMATAL